MKELETYMRKETLKAFEELQEATFGYIKGKFVKRFLSWQVLKPIRARYQSLNKNFPITREEKRKIYNKVLAKYTRPCNVSFADYF